MTFLNYGTRGKSCSRESFPGSYTHFIPFLKSVINDLHDQERQKKHQRATIWVEAFKFLLKMSLCFCKDLVSFQIFLYFVLWFIFSATELWETKKKGFDRKGDVSKEAFMFNKISMKNVHRKWSVVPYNLG